MYDFREITSITLSVLYFPGIFGENFTISRKFPGLSAFSKMLIGNSNSVEEPPQNTVNSCHKYIKN